jgi:hypothetical protein
MTAPIRPEVHALTAFPKEAKTMTLREALEWHKRAVRSLSGVDVRPMETKELNSRWAYLCNEIAEREGVPTGSLSYYLGELAQAEVNLKETAELEATVAQAYLGDQS